MNPENPHIESNRSLRANFDAWEPDFQEDLVWNEIQDSLDIESVWLRVDESLDLEKGWSSINHSLDKLQQETRISRSLAWVVTAAILIFASIWLRDEVPFSKQGVPFNSEKTDHLNKLQTSNQILGKTENNRIVEHSNGFPTDTSIEDNFIVEPNNELELMPNLVQKQTENFVRLDYLPLDFTQNNGQNLRCKPVSLPPKNRFKPQLSVYAGMVYGRMNVVQPRELVSFESQFSTQFGVEFSYGFNRSRVSFLADVTDFKMKEYRYINGKYGSINHRKYQFSTGVQFARTVFEHTEICVGGLISKPFQSISQRGEVIVGLPKTAWEFGGQLGLNHQWNRSIGTSLSYRYTRTTDKIELDWNKTAAWQLTLSYRF